MRIVDIREQTAPISSPIRNAYIDFSKMTLSVVAVVTDVIRDGKPVIGYGFNSNGRYGQGTLMRERFIPRILEADPATLLDDTGENLDPHRIWQAMFTKIGLERGWAPSTRAQFDNLVRPGGAFLVGDPDTVAAKIRQTSEDLGGIDRLTFQMSSAASDQPAMLRSIEMLGREVKPRLSA